MPLRAPSARLLIERPGRGEPPARPVPGTGDSCVPIRPRLLAPLLGPIVCLAALGAVASPASAQTYYVDCSAGSDLNAGTAKTLAWQSLPRASSAALVP